MGERHGRRTGNRALAGLIAAAAVCGLSVVAPAAAHAIQAGSLAATDDNYTMTFTTAGTALNVAAPGVLANDFGPSNSTVDLPDSDTTSLNGVSVFLHANGSFTYKPDPNNPFTGVDTFTYWIQDTIGNQDFATVTIVVNPVVRNDTYFVHKNTTLNVAAPGVFANDLGLDPANALFDSDITSAQGGDVTVNADGSFSYTPPSANFEGTDTFGYTASDIDGDNTFPATVTVHVDNTPPAVVVISPPSLVTLTPNVPVAWRGADLSGIAHYDVEARHAVWNGWLTPWAMWKASTTAGSATYNGNLAVNYCYRARAVDRAGNTSGWSPQRCTAVPMNANSLAYSGPWTRQFRNDVYGGALWSTTTKGATATRTNVHAKRVYLVATRCASCGSVQVRWNNVPITNLNLAYGATLHRQAFLVGSFASAKAGTLTVIVTSATGRTVAIEGLAAYSE